MSRAGEAKVKLDKIGVETLCEDLCSGYSLTAAANEYGVSLSALLNWIEAESERSARVREARHSMAKIWDEKAEDEIRQAVDEFQLKKARELAQHYRWRASKIGIREYGDKVEVKGTMTLEQLITGAGQEAAE